MSLHLKCDECAKLWASYGVAIREAREVGKRQRNPKAPIAPGAVEDVLKCIREHEVLAHGRVGN